MYQETNKNLWKGRIDLEDEGKATRFFQVIQPVSYSTIRSTGKMGIALLGFCCDAGVARNQGRVGAKEGPDAIRRKLSQLAWHNDSIPIIDAGNVICEGDELENAQQELANCVSTLKNKGYFTIVLGGGHETALGHYTGLATSNDQSISILNFDAHFDLRSYKNGASSGTPFLQIADQNKLQNKPFHYRCLGIQELGNTSILFDKANELGVKWLTSNQTNLTNAESVAKFTNQFILEAEQIYITICSDVFNAAVCPGVSASNPTGIFPAIVLQTLQQLISSGKVIGFDVVEINPQLDRDEISAKLAAHLIYQVIQSIISLPQ